MPPQKRISFQNILKDIRSGMSQIGLLEKYNLTPRELLRVFDKLIGQARFTMIEYKEWEAGQTPPLDEPDQVKPHPKKTTPPKGPEVNQVEVAEPPGPVLKKCSLCGQMTDAALGNCRSCGYKLPDSESIKSPAVTGIATNKGNKWSRQFVGASVICGAAFGYPLLCSC